MNKFYFIAQGGGSVTPCTSLSKFGQVVLGTFSKMTTIQRRRAMWSENSQNKNHFSLGQSHYKALIDVLLLLKIWTFWHVNRLIKRKRYTVTKKRIINYRLEDTDNKWRLFLNGVLLSFLSKCRSLMRTWVFDTFLVSKAFIFVDIVKKSLNVVTTTVVNSKVPRSTLKQVKFSIFQTPLHCF